MGRPNPNWRREPNEFIRASAQAYNQKHGLERTIDDLYVAVDVNRARRIADAYEALTLDDSSDPAVLSAYSQFEIEIERQWKYARMKMGMTLEPWTQKGQPYATNSTEMRSDVRRNRHLYFFQGGEPHPLLGEIDPATGLSMNDKFRAIHDLFGHAAEGYGFGPRGEENAWLKHSQMFSATAQRALTTETRGQNAWVNYGAHNYDAAGNRLIIPLKDRPYAIQKIALLPPEFSDFRTILKAVRNLRS